MKISLITPTGCRPEAFKLCELWMSRQTKLANEWIVVDDGEEATRVRYGKHYRVKPFWKPGDNTQARNLKVALEAASGDVIFFIEDDDYYSKGYIQRLSDEFKKHEDLDLVGEVPSLYYNFSRRRYCKCENFNHASLCQTAIRSRIKDKTLKYIEESARWIDIKLWAVPNVTKKLIRTTSPLCVGIKGMPGRCGIGCGHDVTAEAWEHDDDLLYFNSLLGEDAKEYEGK